MSNDVIQGPRKVIFDEATKVRKQVLGEDHVRKSLSLPAFSQPVQKLATEAGWGLIWTRPGLDKRTRSLLCVAMLALMGRNHELQAHTKGAIRNGATETEIQEALLQVGIYAGLPASLEGTRYAAAALEEMRKDNELK